MNTILRNPDVEQHLADAARVSSMEGVILGRVKAGCQLKEDREKPPAVSVEVLIVHNQHIENVCTTPLHELVP